MQEFLKGGALSVARLIEERALPWLLQNFEHYVIIKMLLIK